MTMRIDARDDAPEGRSMGLFVLDARAAGRVDGFHRIATGRDGRRGGSDGEAA